MNPPRAWIPSPRRILKKDHTVVIVSNNTKQIARISDKVAFLLQGELIEYGPPDQIFTMAKDKRTEDYVSGRFG
jgi:phosphate transport system ATP-binding protein